MKPAALPPDLAARPFLVREALPLTGSERLRRLDLCAPTRGVRAPPDTALTPAILRLVLGPSQFFSHTTAARLHGLPVPTREEETLHVSTVGDGSVMRRAGVTGHRIAQDLAQVVSAGPVRASTPTACWAESATLLALDDLIVLGDAVIARNRPGSVADLAALVRLRAGGRRAGVLREALRLIREGSESPQETRLRLLIVRAGHPEPALNVPVLDSRGRSIGRPDLSYPELRIGIEYEGDHHRTDVGTWRSDIRRRERFAAEGWRTLRVVADDLTVHAQSFLTRLERARSVAAAEQGQTSRDRTSRRVEAPDGDN